jgi:hypothetical protein
MSKGVVLEPGKVYVLAIDNTMVYVETVTATFASVVALPEQPPTRTDDRVFTPGKVGAKKISPFSLPDENFPDSEAGHIPVTQLSDRNKDFIGTFEKLREANGPNFVDQTEEEKKRAAAPGGVKKVGPDKEAKKAERAAKREAKKAEREQKKAERLAAKVAAAPPSCEGCDKQFFRTQNGVHYAGADETSPMWGICTILLAAVAPRKQRTPKVVDPNSPAKAPRTPKASTNKSDLKFKLLRDNLAQASAEKDKFKAGNRGHKVYEAFKLALTEEQGRTGGDVVTVGQVIEAAAAKHGADWSNDPEGVVYNALNDLAKDALGSVTELIK